MPAYNDRYVKTKRRKYGDKFYINFFGLNMPEDDAECESFKIISIDYLLIIYENKYYLQVYLENSAYKIVNTEMVGYLDDNIFESD